MSITRDKPLRELTKDPNAVLDYGIRWTDWLVSGDSISTSTWAIDVAPDASLTIDSSSIVDGVPTVWLSGGTAGETYVVRNRVVTADSRTDDRSIVIHVRAR